jgi:hypothetical protein
MIKLITILNELKLNDLVGNQYKYVIGSSEEKYIGENDKKYVLEMIAKSLKAYLYDSEFALNYLDGNQRKEYTKFFETQILIPKLKNIDKTLRDYFELNGDKVKYKLSGVSRVMIDDMFKKYSPISDDIKDSYREYRLEYAGVKLKEGVNESELKGYLIADVVDDIIKVIGPRFVSGEIKQSNRNKIYLKLTDVKVGSGVVKLLKSKFGIDAKEEMFGGKDKFGSIPSVSFFANKVINEELSKKDIEKLTTYKDLSKFIKANKSKINSKDFMYIEDEVEALKYLESDYKKGKADRQEVEVAVIDAQDYIKRGMGIKVESVNEESYKVAGRPVTLIKGKKSDATDWKVKFENGKETSLSDVLALIKPFPKGVHWRYKNLESVNEAAMNPVKKVVNAILKKNGVSAMKTTSTSVKGFHNIQNGGYRYDSDYFLSFYKVPQDIVKKVGAEMEKAGVRGVEVKNGMISADFSKTGLNEK